jgi:hypothetical protein
MQAERGKETYFILILDLGTIWHPDFKVKHCAYGHSVATMQNPRGVTTVSHTYCITVARHATVVVAVPSILHYPINCKIKIYYLRRNLKV